MGLFLVKLERGKACHCLGEVFTESLCSWLLHSWSLWMGGQRLLCVSSRCYSGRSPTLLMGSTCTVHVVVMTDIGHEYTVRV